MTGKAGDVSDAEAVATATVDFLEAVKEMEFQMLDMDLGLADLSFLSNGFKCEALTVAIHLLLFIVPTTNCNAENQMRPFESRTRSFAESVYATLDPDPLVL